MKKTDLSSLLIEVKKELKTQQKRAIKETHKRTMSQLTIEKILDSGALLKEETDILKEYIKYRGNSIMLNENTVKIVNNELLSEGIISWIKDKGKKAMDFLKSGWENIKKVWQNFKDFIKSVIDQIKAAFNKVWKWIQDKVKSLLSWLKDIGKGASKVAAKLPKETKEKIPGEVGNLKACVSHIKTYFSSLINGEKWEKKVEAGDLNVKDSVKEDLFKDKDLIILLKEIDINEGEGGLHPTDILKKFPKTKYIVEHIINGLLFIFNLPVKIVQFIIKKVTDNALKGIGLVSSKTGGPGPFAFAAMGTMLSESAEIIGHSWGAVEDLIEKLLDVSASLVGSFTSWMGPGIGDSFKIICHCVMTFGFYYAIATLVMNVGKVLIDAAKTPLKGAENLSQVRESFTPEFLRMKHLAGLK